MSDFLDDVFGPRPPRASDLPDIGQASTSDADLDAVTSSPPAINVAGAPAAPEPAVMPAPDTPHEREPKAILEHALAMAARGFRVFPLAPGTKVPPKGLAWKIEATTDPAKIRAWWAFEPDYNYAVAAGDGLLIVDVDGATGEASLAALTAQHGPLPDTLKVRTPRGGYHLYMRGPDVLNSAGKIGEKLDVRSAGGYVVGPGSKKGHSDRYYTIESDAAPASAPAWLPLLAGEPKQRSQNREPLCEADLPENVEWVVRNYLTVPPEDGGAPIAIEGRGGNSTAYAVFACLRERGISPELSVELAEEHWNGRCLPPWSHGELVGLAANADAYGQCTFGEKAPSVLGASFGPVTTIEPPAPPPSSGPIFDPWREVIVPELPSGLLPDTIDRFATNQSVVMGACRSAIGFAALSALSGAVNHATSLRMMRNGGWSASPRFWLLLAGPPSSKKTPIIGEALRPLEALQARQWQEWKALCDFQRDDEPKPPTPPRLVAGDVTMEALAGVLAGQERGILVKRDEIAGWIGSMEKYGSGRGPMADRAFWLEAFNGGPYTVDRVTRGTIMVPNLSVSIVGGIQPDRLSELQGLQSDGLLQRFLPVFVGPGRVAEDCRSSNTVYADLIEAAAKLGPMRFEFDDAALTIAARFRQRTHDLQLAAETARPGFAQFVGKLDGLFGTFALLFHVAEGVEHWFPERVSSETAERVEALFLDFIMPHAFEFYGYADHAGGTDKLRKVASWVLTAGRGRFTARDAMREVSCLSGQDAFRIGRELGPLVAGGWLEPETAGPENRAWKVLPAVAHQFEKRREDEERRKQELARLMNGPRRPKG